MKKLILLMVLLSSLVFANDNLHIGNFSVGLNSQDNTCYVMNDVDAFYVYKLYLKQDIKILYVHHRNNGVVVDAIEEYGNHTIKYTFYSNLGTCKTYKNK